MVVKTRNNTVERALISSVVTTRLAVDDARVRRVGVQWLVARRHPRVLVWIGGGWTGNHRGGHGRQRGGGATLFDSVEDGLRP